MDSGGEKMKIIIFTERAVNESLERLHAEARRASWENDHHAIDFIEGQILVWRNIKGEMQELTEIKL